MLGDDEVGFQENDLLGLFDGAPVPTGSAPKAPAGELGEGQCEMPVGATATATTPVAPPVASDERPQPGDFTGGLG